MTTSATVTPIEELPEGTVTILFTDVVGSTELTNRLGDEPAREVLRSCDDLVRQQIERHRGREVKGTGDGLMVAFTSARRAVSCAIDIQRAVLEHFSRDASLALGVRIGLNTGEVVREEADLFGSTVNAAARIAAEGGAGDILVSEGVKLLLGPATTADLESRGEVALKGFPEPWELFSVKWQEAPAPSPGGRTPYVGRAEERAQLRKLLDDAAQGKGNLVMIGGEPGVGKTRISEEILAEAQSKGFLTLTGHCYEMEGAPPYIPFVEIMQAAMRSVSPEGLRHALGEEAAEVAKVVPELRRLFPDIPSPLELPPEQERHYLFNSLRTFVARASQTQPLVLLFDDLHWADDSTLLLVQHYAQELDSMAVLIVGTYRDVELDVGRPLAKTLEDLMRKRLAHRISLRRLPLEDVAAMLQAASGQEPPRPLVDVVYSETEGNPFFVEEVFQHLREEGKLFDEQGRWKQDLIVSELDVPEGVRLVIGRRLQRVAEDTRRVLTNAAVIGRVFSFDLLEAVGAESADALLDAIDEANEAQLINAVTDDDREARYMFAHELIRQTLISSLSLPRRQRLHLRIAEAMEQINGAGIEARAADVAHHLYQAGAAADADRTVHFLALAGNQAEEAAAFEDALRFYDEAIGLRPNANDIAQADLLVGRGMARRSMGVRGPARDDWGQAVSLYEELGAVEQAANVCRELAMQFAWLARWDEGLEVAQRGLRSVPEGAPALRGGLLAVSGALRSLGGDYAQATHELDEAEELARELNDRQLLGRVLGGKVVHYGWHLQAQKVAEIAEQAIQLQIDAGDSWRATETMWAVQYALAFLMRFDEAERMGERCRELAARLGHDGSVFASGRGLIGIRFIQHSDLDEFERGWTEDLESAERSESPWISNSYSNLSRLYFYRGDWDRAEQFARKGADCEPSGMTYGFDWGVLFRVLAYTGQRDEALALLERERGSLPPGGAPATTGAWTALQHAIDGLAILGEQEACAKLYPLAQELLALDVVWSWNFIMAQSTAGIAATEAGDYDKAEQHFAQSLADCARMQFDFAVPEAKYWYAGMLLRRHGAGDRERARSLVDEAVADFERFGMPRHVELAGALFD